MAFYKNKHVILAMFVAPLLSIIAYFAVDYVVSEKPHSAEDGNSYRLVGDSNCRYKSGRCTLRNGDVEIVLQAKRASEGKREQESDNKSEKQLELYLSSELPVQNAVISYVEEAFESEPVKLQASESQGNVLQARLGMMSPEKSHLRLALEIHNTIYYAETTAVFIDYQTAFSQENFSQDNLSQ